MSGNSVKWIPLGGMDLSAANLAPAEKLRKFGFSLVCCEFGSEKLTKAGIIGGMGDGSFAPKNNATRAQAAAMLYHVLTYKEGK